MLLASSILKSLRLWTVNLLKLFWIVLSEHKVNVNLMMSLAGNLMTNNPSDFHSLLGNPVKAFLFLVKAIFLEFKT